jgi:hypothetical protein
MALSPIINSGTETLPFTLGGHPAFNVPIDPSNEEDFADYELHFTKAMTYFCPMMNGKWLYDMNRKYGTTSASLSINE